MTISWLRLAEEKWLFYILVEKGPLKTVFYTINADLQYLPSQMEHEDFVMEGHGKTPPPGEENKQ